MKTNTFALIGSKNSPILSGAYITASLLLALTSPALGGRKRAFYDAKGFNPDIAIFPNCIVFSAVGLRC